MLKITQSDKHGDRVWTLCGRLSGPWVAEFRAGWERCRPDARSNVIDLTEVISIDERGESLLREMKKDGARFVARGVEMKSILAALRSKSNPAMRKCLAHLDCDYS